MGSLDDLIRLVPPPEKPVVFDGDWQSVEKELGLVLPLGFKRSPRAMEREASTTSTC
ncbi:hypothetical protein [Amycolatopsis speibonae]|uniref:Uncharacterized protein n=1 Tax=Amycolatopsis speibonae TaxID=1450224 RepID=A0ABV7NYD8_9PSEU